MKSVTVLHTTCTSTPRIPYPNAASRKEIFGKFIDLLLVGAIGAGAAAILLFILALG